MFRKDFFLHVYGFICKSFVLIEGSYKTVTVNISREQPMQNKCKLSLFMRDDKKCNIPHACRTG